MLGAEAHTGPVGAGSRPAPVRRTTLQLTSWDGPGHEAARSRRRAAAGPVPPTGPVPPERGDIALLSGIADGGSLRAGARRAGCTQPAAVRRIARLERTYSVSLVARGPSLAVLTPAGHGLLEAAQSLLNELEAVTSCALAGAATASRSPAPSRDPAVLRIAGAGCSWSGWLVDDLGSWLDAAVRVTVTDDVAEARERFEAGAADAVYGWGSAGEPTPSGRCRASLPVLEEPVWVRLPSRHPAAARHTVSLVGLAGTAWVTGPDQDLALLRDSCAAVGFVPRIGAISRSRSVRRGLLLRGDRAALASPMSRPAPGGTVVLRALRETVLRRYDLDVDPTVIGPELHGLLRDRLRCGYRRLARTRNPEYAGSAAFPVPRDDQPGYPPHPLDPALLAGLPRLAVGSDPGVGGERPPVGGGADAPGRLALEPDDLQVLRLVQRCGSLNRAAALLSVAQPTLSRRLVGLESRLGRQLVSRGPRGAALTAAGVRLLELAEPAERAFRAAVEHLHAVHGCA